MILMCLPHFLQEFPMSGRWRMKSGLKVSCSTRIQPRRDLAGASYIFHSYFNHISTRGFSIFYGGWWNVSQGLKFLAGLEGIQGESSAVLAPAAGWRKTWYNSLILWPAFWSSWLESLEDLPDPLNLRVLARSLKRFVIKCYKSIHVGEIRGN